jgi:hypothetical protein
MLRQLRNAGQQDAALEIGIGKVDVQEQTASLQSLG